MEVARTSVIQAAAPHFLWPFAVRYTAHQLNFWPRVSLPETSPTLRWTGEVGDASVFWVWGSRTFVRDTSANKLSARTIPYVFLGFPPDAPGWQFYHPTSRRGPAPSGVSQVDPLPGTVPVEVAVDSGAPRCAISEGAASGGAEPGGAEPWDTEPGGAERGGAESEGTMSGGAEPGGVEPTGVESWGVEPEGVEPGESLSPQQLRKLFTQGTCLRSGAAGAGDPVAVDTGARGAGVTAGAGGTGGAAATGPGGARTRGNGAAETGSVRGAGAGDPTEPGAAGSKGVGAGGAGAVGAGAGDIGAEGAGPGGARAVDLGAGGAHAGGAMSGGTGANVVSLCLVLRPLFELVVAFLVCVLLVSPTHTLWHFVLPLFPCVFLFLLFLSPLFPAVLDPESDRARAASPTVSRLLATILTDPPFESIGTSALVAELDDFAATCHLDYTIAIAAEYESATPSSIRGECALSTDVLEYRQEDFESLAAAAITGPYSSQWQAAMDAEMASWKSTGTYVDAFPPPGANIVDGMWIFRGVDYFQTFSPTPKMTTLRVLLHVATQRDYELHSLDFSTAFLQGSLHEETSLRRPPGFTRSFPGGTQWSLCCAKVLQWHGHRTPIQPTSLLSFWNFVGWCLNMYPSLFLRADKSLPPLYILMYFNDLVFATADTEALTLLTLELQKKHTCTDLGELCSYLDLLITRNRARRTITLTKLHMVHQSVEPSGPYPELMGCLMYLMTCTRPDLAYPLSLLTRYVAPVVLTGHADASWVDDSATQRSSQGYTFSLDSGSVSWRSTCSSSVLSSCCEAEIYAGAMAAQELPWLTYLLTEESILVRLQTKHIALRYFLAQELQQRGQLRLAYVATRANTADVFTKALPLGDHQRFSTVLGLVPTLPHLLTA
ncbi:unnamed protein product [Closterium sp. NIES-53]